METILLLLIIIVYQTILFKSFSDGWAKEWEKFEKRIDEKIELSDTFNRIENNQARLERLRK